jgi:hypothetical protein
MGPDSWYAFMQDVKVAYDRFWEKNQLTYKDGRIYRTSIPRVRPKGQYELDFRTKKGKKYEEISSKEF